MQNAESKTRPLFTRSEEKKEKEKKKKEEAENRKAQKVRDMSVLAQMAELREPAITEIDKPTTQTEVEPEEEAFENFFGDNDSGKYKQMSTPELFH